MEVFTLHQRFKHSWLSSPRPREFPSSPSHRMSQSFVPRKFQSSLPREKSKNFLLCSLGKNFTFSVTSYIHSTRPKLFFFFSLHISTPKLWLESGLGCLESELPPIKPGAVFAFYVIELVESHGPQSTQRSLAKNITRFWAQWFFSNRSTCIICGFADVNHTSPHR